MQRTPCKLMHPCLDYYTLVQRTVKCVPYVVESPRISHQWFARTDLTDALCARLEKEEADTAFRTVLDEYESRMPQIVQTIRNMNADRIAQVGLCTLD